MTLNLKSTSTVPWKDQLPDGAIPTVVHFGRDDQGVGAVQVAVATVTARPTKSAMTSMWKTRGQNTAMPVVVAAVAGDDVWFHGPDEKEDPVGPVSVSQAERFLQSVLDEPHGIAAHTQLRAIGTHLATVGGAGYVNHFLFATYHLRNDVPQRGDWAAAGEKAAAMLTKRGKHLIEALGFDTEPAAGGALVLRGRSKLRRAIAVLLDESENFDQKSAKYQLSPVAHGLEVAGREDVPWVIVMRRDSLRLYPGRDGVGVGQRGQSETYFELDLAFVDQEFAGLLPLIFSADALEKGGSADEILKRSGKYAADLGTRLRDRVYEGVVPGIATAIAQRLPSLGLGVDADGLRTAYALTMRILFRLLFQAYGESTELLPVDNENYRANSLTRFVASTDESKGFDETASSIWRDLLQVWDAISNGNKQWGIPPYGGSLFDQASPEGELIERLKLPDSVMGPALRAMLTERTEDGVLGAVDFRSLQVREFGTIYEGLLESSLSVAEGDLALDKNGAFVPAKEVDEIAAHAGEAYFHSASGERKATGSYYTPKIVVDHLLERSVEPAIIAHLTKIKELMDAGRERDAAEAFFDFRVADLAMGSAHFLVAAVDKIERYMRDFLTTIPVPGVRAELARLADSARRALNEVSHANVEISEAQLLRRQVARRCVYGLDINPLAVELSQLAIWIHTFVPGLPMASLEQGLILGNSLTGIATVEEAIEALDPHRLPGQGIFFDDVLLHELGAAKHLLQDVAAADEASKSEVENGQRLIAEARLRTMMTRQIFDAAVAVRAGEVPARAILMREDLDELLRNPAVATIADRVDPAHFPYYFPGVFLRKNPGFDVVVGNPPWEKLQVEEHSFYALAFPGLRGLTQAAAEDLLAKIRFERPDLVSAYHEATEASRLAQRVLARGPYPGLTAGRPDLYKAFAWRMWDLVRTGGRIGVVLPRKALEASGMKDWRLAVLLDGTFDDVTVLTNTAGWVFENVHGQYSIAVVSIEADRNRGAKSIAVRGPYGSAAELAAGAQTTPAPISVSDLLSWSPAGALPLLPDAMSSEIFLRMRRQPRLDDGDESLQVRGLREWNATDDKHRFIFSGPGEDLIPVYKGDSFDLWTPTTGSVYAHASRRRMQDDLQARRINQVGNKRSAFFQMPKDWVTDPATLPMNRPRIAWRDVTNRTNQRTVIVALIPPDTVLVHQAYYLFLRRGNARLEAFLLGVLSSIPFDWFARQVVESHITVEFLLSAPVPRPRLDDPVHARLSNVSALLAAPDRRFHAWANDAGVEIGAVVNESMKADLVAEIDALVALAYGLNEHQIEYMFGTFHRGWDYRSRLDAVLGHYARWKDAT